MAHLRETTLRELGREMTQIRQLTEDVLRRLEDSFIFTLEDVSKMTFQDLIDVGLAPVTIRYLQELYLSPSSLHPSTSFAQDEGNMSVDQTIGKRKATPEPRSSTDISSSPFPPAAALGSNPIEIESIIDDEILSLPDHNSCGTKRIRFGKQSTLDKIHVRCDNPQMPLIILIVCLGHGALLEHEIRQNKHEDNHARA